MSRSDRGTAMLDTSAEMGDIEPFPGRNRPAGTGM